MFVNFADLKAKVTIEQVLEWLGVTLKKSGEQLRGSCPICNSSSDRCFVVTPSKGLYHCFESSCGKGGDLIQLVADVNGVDQKEAAQAIAKHFLTGQKEAPAEKDLSAIAAYLQPEHELVQVLGVYKETCEVFGAGYKPKGVLAGRLAIPIHDGQGNLLAYVGRAVKKGQLPTLAFPKGFDPGAHLFNVHRIQQGELRFCCDPLHVLVASQLGFQAVAFLGPATPKTLKALAELLESKGLKEIELL